MPKPKAVEIRGSQKSYDPSDLAFEAEVSAYAMEVALWNIRQHHDRDHALVALNDRPMDAVLCLGAEPRDAIGGTAATQPRVQGVNG